MSLTMDWVHDDKVLFSDNILVGRTKWGLYFFSIFITDQGASINRYCVPGRIDTYTFNWVRGSTGLGSRVAFFTDTHISLAKAVTQARRDLGKKQVKELLRQAKLKCPRSYLDPLLDTLDETLP